MKDETVLLIIEGRRAQLAKELLAKATHADTSPHYYGVLLMPSQAREIAYLLEAAT
jgi:hypothetical protein